MKVNFSEKLLKSRAYVQSPQAICIGASTGGFNALAKIFSDLKGCKIEIPIFITQHVPQAFDETFATKISKSGEISCVVASDNTQVEKGKVYLAPYGFHMSVIKTSLGIFIKLDNSDPINFCKPSVDPLFSSVAALYGKNTFAIMLTGIGSDGLEGSKAIYSKGGTIIAQDEATSVVWGMPGAVAKASIATAVLPLSEIAEFLIEFSAGKIIR